jgi:hypothetical protein
MGFSLFRYYHNELYGNFNEHLGFHARKEFREAANFVIDNFQDKDGIFHTCPETTYPFEYYLKIASPNNKFDQVESNVVLNVDYKHNAVVPLRYASHAPYEDLSDKINLKNYKRIWLVYSAWILPNSLYPENFKRWNQLPECRELEIVQAYLDNNYNFLFRKRFKGVSVLLYEVPH